MVKEVSIPNYIPSSSIPTYLGDYIDNLTVPKTITSSFLSKVSIELLHEKQSFYELNYGKRRALPDRLDFDEVAGVLMTFFSFRNIRLSSTQSGYVLGLYVSSGLNEGVYQTDRKNIYRLIEPLAPKFRNSDMDDVLDKIERLVPIVDLETNPDLSPVNNGVFDKSTNELLPFSESLVFTTKIPIDYTPNAKNPIITMPDGEEWDVDSWIADLMEDKESEELIWQVIADTLQPNYSRGKSVWFYSKKGNNGKGTLGELIKNLLGRGNYASLAVTDFRHEFLKEQLLGVAANISDENDVDVYIDSIRDYKASVTGDDININRKYEKPITLQFHGTNIQMMNGLPKTKDKSDSFYRRLILVPFVKSFTNNGERPYIKHDYVRRKDVLEYVLYKALHIKFEEFTVPTRSKMLLMEYQSANNPVIQFWDEYKDEFVWDLLPNQFLYDAYLSWNKRNNPSGIALSRQNFLENMTILAVKDGEWKDKSGQGSKVRSNNRMDDDEPLITELGLTEWMDQTYKGNDLVKLRDFPRKQTYRGLERI